MWASQAPRTVSCIWSYSIWVVSCPVRQVSVPLSHPHEKIGLAPAIARQHDAPQSSKMASSWQWPVYVSQTLMVSGVHS